MRRLILMLILAVSFGALTSCTPAPAPLRYYSNWNPVTEREEGFFAACATVDGHHVRAAAGAELFVQVTLPGNVVEEGWTQRVDQNDPYLFVSDATVDIGECYSVLLLDTLGNGPFIYWPVFGL